MEKREKNMKYNCPYDKKCGGCNLLKHDYAEQLKIKKAALAKLLAPYGRLTEVIGMDEPLHYRNKVHAVFTTDRKGNIISGVCMRRERTRLLRSITALSKMKKPMR